MILKSRKKKEREKEAAVQEEQGQAEAAQAMVNGSPPAEDIESRDPEVASNPELQAALDEYTKLKAEALESHEKYLRTLADLENFKRRAMKERSDLLRYEGEKILLELLEVVDNFERALQNIDADPTQVKNGVELIYRGLLGILDRFGVRPKPAIGKPFDPNEHNALSRQEVGDGVEAGLVMHELKKAYFYKDKLLRPAEVVVGVAAEVQNGEDTEGKEESS